jgi:hypothetical protein
MEFKVLSKPSPSKWAIAGRTQNEVLGDLAFKNQNFLLRDLEGLVTGSVNFSPP